MNAQTDNKYVAKVYYFDMTVNNDEDKELSYNEIDLIDIGEAYFKKLYLKVGIDEAIDIIACDASGIIKGHNLIKAKAEFVERGLASEYITKLLMRHPVVIGLAEQNAIETYRGI